MTVAISPFSKTSDPRAMITSRASLQLRGAKEVFETGAQIPPFEVPGRGLPEQIRLKARFLCSQLEAKHVPKQMMEAKPHPTRVQGDQEHRFPFELLQNQLRTRLTGEEGNQVRTHRVQY